MYDGLTGLTVLTQNPVRAAAKSYAKKDYAVTVRYHRNVTVQTKIEVMYSRKRLYYFEGPRMPWPQPHIRKSHRFKISLRSGIAVICFTNAHAPAGSIHNIHNRDRIRCQSEGPDHL